MADSEMRSFAVMVILGFIKSFYVFGSAAPVFISLVAISTESILMMSVSSTSLEISASTEVFTASVSFYALRAVTGSRTASLGVILPRLAIARGDVIFFFEIDALDEDICF